MKTGMGAVLVATAFVLSMAVGVAWAVTMPTYGLPGMAAVITSWVIIVGEREQF